MTSLGYYSLPDRPEKKLAELMTEELGVSINAHALRMFLLMNWDDVSKYSHAVHDEFIAPKADNSKAALAQGEAN